MNIISCFKLFEEMELGVTWYINIKGIITESNSTVNNFFRNSNWINSWIKVSSEKNKSVNQRKVKTSKPKKSK